MQLIKQDSVLKGLEKLDLTDGQKRVVEKYGLDPDHVRQTKILESLEDTRVPASEAKARGLDKPSETLNEEAQKVALTNEQKVAGVKLGVSPEQIQKSESTDYSHKPTQSEIDAEIDRLLRPKMYQKFNDSRWFSKHNETEYVFNSYTNTWKLN